jgi:hypothetical protein
MVRAMLKKQHVEWMGGIHISPIQPSPQNNLKKQEILLFGCSVQSPSHVGINMECVEVPYSFF